MNSRPTWRFRRLAIVLLAVIGGIAGVSYATAAVTHIATTTISACEKQNGQIRIVTSPMNCPAQPAALDLERRRRRRPSWPRRASGASRPER